MSTSLVEILHRLSSAFERSAAQTGTRIKTTLLPPCAPGDIAAFEARIQAKLPPSYVEFLLLHNGWLKYKNTYDLLGVSGPLAEKLEAEFQRMLGRFDAAQKRHLKYPKNQENPDLLANQGLDPHKLIAFGADYTNGCLYFNPDVVTAAGEYEVVDVQNTEKIRRRYPDFMTMLESTLRAWES